MNLDDRFQARLTESVELGVIDGGVRIDNYFDGEITEGELAGARVRGVDQIRIRPGGSVALDIRETIEAELGAIGADVRGYALPNPEAPHLHTIHGFALFTTGVPEYAAYNTALVEIEGTVDMITRELVIEGRATPQVA
jgi:hypothetical protein